MPGFTESSTKGRKSSKAGKGSSEPIRLRVSNPSLKKGVRIVEQDGLKATLTVKSHLPSTKKTKSPALKEITNSLDIWPIKLKPNWSGLRLGNGLANKARKCR